MAYDPVESFDPALWGVTQADFDNSEALHKKLSEISVYQPVGTPINQYPFFTRVTDDTDYTNPVSVQYFGVGMHMGAALGPASYAEQFSQILTKVNKTSLVGYAYNTMNNSAAMANNARATNSPSPGYNGNGSSNSLNGEFNNRWRWYTSQATVDSVYGSWQAYLKLNRNYICLSLKIYAMKHITPYAVFDSEGITEAVRVYTFDYQDYISGNNSINYPYILAAEIVAYQGTTATRNLIDFGYFTDVSCAVDSVWKKFTYSSGNFSATDPNAGRLSPAGIEAHAYMCSKTIYQGFNLVSNSNTQQTHWRCCRGLNRHNFIRFFERTSSSNYIPHMIAVFDGGYLQIMEALQKLGLPWTTSTQKAQTGDIENDPDIYVPRFDPKTGVVKDSTNDPEKKKKELDSNPYGAPVDPTTWDTEYDPDPEDPDDPEYDPEDDPEEEKEKDEIPMIPPTLGTVGVFNRSYAINAAELTALSNYLWNVDETEFEKIIKGLQLIGTNPINAIISVFLYPFEVASGTPHNIRIGVVDTDISAVPIGATTVREFDLGSLYFWAKYKNYMDYEPYTTASLYIPYVGIISLPVSEYIKRYINVRLAVDLMTGAGQVVVYADGIPTIYRNCKIGAQIAVTGQDSSRIAANYISAARSILSAGNGVAMSAAAGNVQGVGGGIMQAARGALDLFTAGHVPIESAGCDSPQCGYFMPQNCYLIVNRPRTMDIDKTIYGRTIGYACCETGYIQQFAGFSRFDNVVLNITVATDAEKREIIDKLRGGVYV